MKIQTNLQILSTPLESLIASMFRDVKPLLNSMYNKQAILVDFEEIYKSIKILTNPMIFNSRRSYIESDPIEALDALSNAICIEDQFSHLAQLILNDTDNSKIEIIVNNPDGINEISKFLSSKCYIIHVRH